MSAAARRAVGVVSPAHRRWSQLLESLTLDPDHLPQPVEPVGPADFLICGSPRSGTALLTAMLYQPPEVVTVMEPWDALRLPPVGLFRSLRAEISQGVLRRGRLDIGALLATGSVTWCRDGERPHQVDAREDTLLGVKFPAFWRYLDLLPDAKFLVCLRDPSEVVRSYRLTGGRLRLGLDYDVPFNARMNAHLEAATSDPARRRVLLYDYVNSRILPHLERPNVMAVRYERWFTDPSGLLAEVAQFLEVGLGPGRPELKRPPLPATADEDAGLVTEVCTTARALGYEPGRSS